MAETPHILVVDDERGIREGCRRIFEAEGFRVEVAVDGQEGLAKVEAGAFDLLLVDLMMPVMGGLELMERVHALAPEIVMIVITGFATIETAVDAMKRGAYDYVPKPFTPDQLLAVVNRGLEKRRLSLQTAQLLAERDRRLLEVAGERSKLRTIVNSMADGVLVTNRDRQIALWNPASVRMLDLGDAIQAGRPVSEAVPQAALLEVMARALAPESAQFTTLSQEIETGGSDRRTLMANVSVIRDENAEALGVVSILRDITQQKEIDRLKSQFVNMVAHELRAPLGAIAGYLSAYLSSAAGNDPAFNRQMLERSLQRTQALTELVNDLLHVAKLESRSFVRRKERLDVAPLARATLELFKSQAAGRRLTIEEHIPEGLPRIEADRSEIELLLTNLIANAVKYNVEGGKIAVGLKAEGPTLVIRIADTGIGIASEDLPHLFEEFFRVQRSETQYITGTGLGLAIVRRIVEANFGRIAVDSRLNEGTAFTISFPIQEDH